MQDLHATLQGVSIPEDIRHLAFLTRFHLPDFFPVIRGEKAPPLPSQFQYQDQEAAYPLCCLQLTQGRIELQDSLPDAAYVVLSVTEQDLLVALLYDQQIEANPDEAIPIRDLTLEQLPQGIYQLAQSLRQRFEQSACSTVEVEALVIGLIQTLLNDRDLLQTMLHSKESLKDRICQLAIEKVIQKGVFDIPEPSSKPS